MKKIIGILITVLIFSVAVSTAAASATVTTDRKTAEPGDTVTITGKVAADENVVVKITDEAGNIVFFDAAKADASGNYTVSFVVPSGMAAGKLTITAGNGSDIAVTTVSVKSPPAPSSTPKPTAAPSSVPSASSPSEPTAAPSSSPSVSSTPEPSAISTSTTVPTPAASSGPSATNGEQEDVPDTGDSAKAITPIQVKENEEAETVTIEIDVSDLPEGTAAVRLPNGEIVKLDGSDTLVIEIKKSDIADDGLLQITALDEEGTPLGIYAVQLAQFSVPGTGNTGGGVWPVLMWILIGIVGLGAAGLALYLVLRKRQGV